MSLNQPQQAMLIWPVLVQAARMQRVLTYGEVEDFTGVLARGQATPLHLIYLYCKRKSFPELNSIVVNQETGFPGDNYPDDKGILDYLKERATVFTFNWAVKDKPRSEDFV
jgi:hypothetical protein